MKKIAIISEFNRNSVNYGNRLQAMALNQYLISQYPEYKIEYLYFDFWDNFIVTKKKKFIEIVVDSFGSIFRRINKKVHRVVGIKKRLDACEKFSIQYMTLADKSYTWERLLNSDFDAIIIGSDVVWSQGSAKIGRLRFLDFETQKSFDRISYAASFGKEWIPDENIIEVQRCLNRFKAISVRERSSVRFLDKFHIRAVHVVDPTMLLNKEEWENYECKPNKELLEKYVFVYLLGQDKRMRDEIIKWAKSKELCVVTIPYASGDSNKVDKYFGDVKFMDCSPENWLWLIHHAEYIITDSFHGSVFSIIFERKLIVMKRIEKVNINNRMIDFMSMINQMNKIISSDNLDVIESLKWNYSEIKSIISKEIEFSEEFIKRVL